MRPRRSVMLGCLILTGALCLGCTAEGLRQFQEAQRDPVGSFVRSGLYDAIRQQRLRSGQDVRVECTQHCTTYTCHTVCETY